MKSSQKPSEPENQEMEMHNREEVNYDKIVQQII
jgi:hypothetical protein